MKWNFHSTIFEVSKLTHLEWHNLIPFKQADFDICNWKTLKVSEMN